MLADDDNHHFGATDETTKRLVGRCGRVGWLRDDEGPGSSPTWVKQRLLSVDLPSAMESSLSVVEVTTQREKPGVKTPSRAEGDRATANNRNDGRDSGTDDRGGINDADGIQKAIGAEKSPFEAEGEA